MWFQAEVSKYTAVQTQHLGLNRPNWVPIGGVASWAGPPLLIDFVKRHGSALHRRPAFNWGLLPVLVDPDTLEEPLIGTSAECAFVLPQHRSADGQQTNTLAAAQQQDHEPVPPYPAIR
jgi:hypothetical protein